VVFPAGQLTNILYAIYICTVKCAVADLEDGENPTEGTKQSNPYRMLITTCNMRMLFGSNRENCPQRYLDVVYYTLLCAGHYIALASSYYILYYYLLTIPRKLRYFKPLLYSSLTTTTKSTRRLGDYIRVNIVVHRIRQIPVQTFNRFIMHTQEDVFTCSVWTMYKYMDV